MVLEAYQIGKQGLQSLKKYLFYSAAMNKEYNYNYGHY